MRASNAIMGKKCQAWAKNLCKPRGTHAEDERVDERKTRKHRRRGSRTTDHGHGRVRFFRPLIAIATATATDTTKAL